MDFVAATRDSYDALVPVYAEGPPELHPFDRRLYAAFAEMVTGPVADVGCGKGWTTALLRDHGCDAFGVDLSPGMVDLARRSYPHLRFEVGSMLELDLPDASLGGLLANYSIVHIPWDLRPRLFAEFHRVLAPQGVVMLTFQPGVEHKHRTEAWGHAVDLHWYRQEPDQVAAMLADAGFEVIATAVRQAEADAPKTHACVLARA